jgi:colanic acid biosynthesis glycosyl transferase WcaI
MSPPSPTPAQGPGDPLEGGRPRLIFVNRYFHPDHSATAQILTDLCRYLSSSGWPVEVVTSRRLYADPGARLPTRQEVDGTLIRRVWTSDFGRRTLVGRSLDYLSFYVSAFLELAALCRPGDIVVAKTDPPLVSLIAGAAAKLRGASLVNWLQDLYPEIAEQLGIRVVAGPVGAGLRRLRDGSLRKAAANVVIGAGMKDRVLRQGAPEERVAVIPNWSDDEDIQVLPLAPSSLRQAWGLAADDFVVGYSGNLGQAHEVETVLEAARLLRNRPEIKFLFVGGGHHSDRLGRAVAEEGLGGFLFMPYQPKERLSEALAVANVHWLSLRPEFEGLVLPSKFYGIAAAGRPVITVTDLQGELAELVRMHRCGIAIAPGDGAGLASAISELAADTAACEAMGREARAMLTAHFTRAGSFSKWDELLKAVAARR